MFKYVSYTPMTDAYTTHIFNEKNDKCKIHRFDVPYVSVEYGEEDDFTELMAFQKEFINATEIAYEQFSDLVEHSAQVRRMYDVANEQYKNDMRPMTSKYSSEEISSWLAQTAEAKAVLEGTAAETPYLDAIVSDTEMTHMEAAQKVIADKSEYDTFDAAAISAKRIKLNELKKEIGLADSNAALLY